MSKNHGRWRGSQVCLLSISNYTPGWVMIYVARSDWQAIGHLSALTGVWCRASGDWCLVWCNPSGSRVQTANPGIKSRKRACNRKSPDCNRLLPPRHALHLCQSGHVYIPPYLTPPPTGTTFQWTGRRASVTRCSRVSGNNQIS
jgi:hypothetical protein